MKEGSAAQLRRAAAGPRGGPAGARARRDRGRSGSPGPSKLHPSRSKMLHIDHSDYTMIIPLERNVFRVDQWPAARRRLAVTLNLLEVTTSTVLWYRGRRSRASPLGHGAAAVPARPAPRPRPGPQPQDSPESPDSESPDSESLARRRVGNAPGPPVYGPVRSPAPASGRRAPPRWLGLFNRD
jgi:hypothetical protein